MKSATSPIVLSPKLPPQIEVESVTCFSCGFTEDCTPAYILRVRDRYNERWICGLCVEAVKDEVVRSGMYISTEEGLNRLISFYDKMKTEPSEDETEQPISVMGRIMRRSLDSATTLVLQRDGVPSNSPEDSFEGSVKANMVRSGSCFSSLSG